MIQRFKEFCNINEFHPNDKKTNSAVAILIISTKAKTCLLFELSGKIGVKGDWALPREFVQDSENVDATVDRCIKKYMKYNGPIKLKPSYVTTPGGTAKFVTSYFIGFVPEEFEPTLYPDHDTYSWMSFKEIVKLSTKGEEILDFINKDKSIKSFI